MNVPVDDLVIVVIVVVVVVVVVVVKAVWPMEYIKTQLQLFGKKPDAPFNSMLGGLRYTVQTTGFISLYRGLGVNILGSAPKAGIRFSVNSHIKKIMSDDGRKQLNMGQQFLGGMGAGAVEAVIAVTPMETIKTKLIQSNQSLIPGIRLILKESGIRGLYQGVVATIMKQGSNQGLRFMFFNTYKDFVTDYGKKKLHPMMALLGGMCAGCFSTLGNNPIDVVKTRMQGRGAGQYKSTLDCFRRIWVEEGIGGFYSGVFPRLARVIPGQGVIFMSFEAIQEFLAGHVFQRFAL